MARISSTSSLRDADTKSTAPAHARVLQSLAGRVLYLAELIQGRIPVTLGRSATPINPQGRIGLDHSGPPFGSAWRHPLLTMGGCLADTSGDCAGQRVVGVFSSADALVIPLNLYVRPFAMRAGAPYSRGMVTARVARVSGAGSVDYEIVTHSGGGTSNVPMRATSSTSSTTPTHTAPTTIWFDLVPGHNALQLEFVTASATQLVVEQFHIWQSQWRSHL